MIRMVVEPTGAISSAIKIPGSFAAFKQQFNNAGEKRLVAAGVVRTPTASSKSEYTQPRQSLNGGQLSDHGQRRVGTCLLS